MAKILTYFNRGLEIFLGVFLLVMVFVVFLQIVMRGVFSYSFSWTEEVARYLMIWVTFLGAAIAFERGAHIGVSMVVDKLSPLLRKIVKIIVALACLAFFAVLILKGLEIVKLAMWQKSPALRLPMGYVYLAIPVSGLFMTVNLINRSILDIREGWK